MDEEDKKLWKHVTRDIIPLLPETQEDATPAKKTPPRPIKREKIPRPLAQPPASQAIAKQTKTSMDGRDGIDARNWERFRKGKMPLDGILDLHGMRQDEALNALTQFIERHYRRKSRFLIVITGKGSRKLQQSEEGEIGVLKKNFSRWLDLPTLDEKILKYAPAQPKDGGSGAFYVLLRSNAKDI